MTSGTGKQKARETDEFEIVPRHLAVTMDGNGRWAAERGKPRTEGHREGIKALRRLIEYCIRYGVAHVTIFSFSSENWSRPESEVSFIFNLLRRFVASDLEELIRNNVRVRIIGSRNRLDRTLLKIIDDVQKRTAANTGLELIVAFNYGGRDDILDAARTIAKRVAAGELEPEQIDCDVFDGALSTAGIPEPDVLLRTSGEFRISNFLLWQAAYSELVFVDQYWPDFDEDTFRSVLKSFAGRERRFGGIEARTGS